MNGRSSPPPNVYLRYSYFVQYPPLPEDVEWASKQRFDGGDSFDNHSLEVPDFDFSFERKVIESAEEDRIKSELLLREHLDYLQAKAEHRRMRIAEQKRIEQEQRLLQQQQEQQQLQLRKEQEEQARLQKEQQLRQEQEQKGLEQEKERQQQLLLQQQFEQLQLQQQPQATYLPPPPSYSPPQSQPNSPPPIPPQTKPVEKKEEVKRDKESMRHLREHILATQKLLNPSSSSAPSIASALPPPPLYPVYNGGVPTMNVMNGYHSMSTPQQPPPYGNGLHPLNNGANLMNGLYPQPIPLQPSMPIPSSQPSQNLAWDIGCQLFGETNVDKVNDDKSAGSSDALTQHFRFL